jgi:hypothetical protein
MAEIIIARASDPYAKHLRAGDKNKNGKIDSAYEAREAAVSFCREEFSDCDLMIDYLQTEKFPLTRREINQALAERLSNDPGKDSNTLRRSASLLGKLILLDIKPKTKLKAIETLLKAINDDEPSTLFAVFIALEDLAPSDLPVAWKEKVVLKIAAASGTDNKYRRILAVRALGEYAGSNISLGTKRVAIEHLISRLEDDEEQIREATLDSLRCYYISKITSEMRTMIRVAVRAAKR